MSDADLPFPQARRVSPQAPLAWLKAGFADLAAHPAPSLFYGFCFTFFGYVFAFALRDAPQYLVAAIAGFLLVGPALAIGLYEISRLREAGAPVSLAPTLTAWKANLSNLGLFSAVLLVIFLIWSRASLVTFALSFSGQMPSTQAFIQMVAAPENLDFLLAWLGIGALFATLVFAIGVVAAPLMLDRKYDAITAMLASVNVFRSNLPAMAVWGALIAGLVALSMVTYFLGLVITVPLIGHGTWHAYRALVTIPPATE